MNTLCDDKSLPLKVFIAINQNLIREEFQNILIFCSLKRTQENLQCYDFKISWKKCTKGAKHNQCFFF